jgi:uncharacterized integral membrane protein
LIYLAVLIIMTLKLFWAINVLPNENENIFSTLTAAFLGYTLLAQGIERTSIEILRKAFRILRLISVVVFIISAIMLFILNINQLLLTVLQIVSFSIAGIGCITVFIGMIRNNE